MKPREKKNSVFVLCRRDSLFVHLNCSLEGHSKGFSQGKKCKPVELKSGASVIAYLE